MRRIVTFLRKSYGNFILVYLIVFNYNYIVKVYALKRKEDQSMAEKKKQRSVWPVILIFVLIVAGAIIYSKISDMTFKSNPGIIGNTAGNLYNYGLFCDDGERIYFSNYKDQGLLYSMSYDLDDYKFVTKDVARYINHDDHYLYYSRNNNMKDQAARSVFTFYSNGVFRVTPNGKHQIMIWNKPVGSVLYFDGQVYYQHYAEGEKLTIHRADIDGKEDVQLNLDESVAVSAAGNQIYYAGVTHDRALYSVNENGLNGSKVLDGSFFNPWVIGNSVYYIDVNDGYKLKIVGLDGNGGETLTDKRISAYNITSNGRYIFFQYDSKDRSGLYLLDRTSGEEMLIKEGNYKWLNVIGNRCFFYDSSGSMVYVYTIGSGIATFDPPILKN